MVYRLYDSFISLGSAGCRAVHFSLGYGWGFSIGCFCQSRISGEGIVSYYHVSCCLAKWIENTVAMSLISALRDGPTAPEQCCSFSSARVTANNQSTTHTHMYMHNTHTCAYTLTHTTEESKTGLTGMKVSLHLLQLHKGRAECSSWRASLMSFPSLVLAPWQHGRQTLGASLLWLLLLLCICAPSGPWGGLPLPSSVLS